MIERMLSLGRARFKSAAAAVVVVAALAAVVAGCGGSSGASADNPTTTSGAAGDNSATPVPASGKPGGTLRIAINVSLADMDPLTNSGDPYRNSVRLAMFDTLTRYQNNKLVPSLATWSALDGGKAYEFTLRDGVKFSDGKTLTSDDVKYTFDRVADKKVGVYFADLLSDVKSVDVLDARRFRVTLAAPSAGFLDALINMSIVENGSGDKNRTHPVGTGPFTFVKLVPNQELDLKKNPNYWRSGLPKVDEVQFVPVKQSQVALQDLRAGSADLATDLPATLWKTARTDPSLRAVQRPSTTMTYVDFFSKNLPKTDPRLRQAMIMCFDSNAALKIAYGGIGTVSQNILPPGSPFYSDVVQPYRDDAAAAKKLLAEAGFPNGLSLTIDGLQGFDQINQALTIWQDGLRKCGINAKVRIQEFNAWLDAFFKHKLQVTMDVDSQGLDPNRFYNISFVGPHAGGGDAVSKRLLELGKEANQTLDPKKRKEFYAQYATEAHKDLHAVPLIRTPTLYATRSNVGGVDADLLGFYDLTRATVNP
jgi:peptide/nickel transport system substrate-binding protein